mmetsp:Transcript_20455/g.28543  ORF Transcript_20455/g.28543 Transcript_20455/m.28543 type:complete len:238 (+) Transcript_20455:206-919(+)
MIRFRSRRTWKRAREIMLIAQKTKCFGWYTLKCVTNGVPPIAPRTMTGVAPSMPRSPGGSGQIELVSLSPFASFILFSASTSPRCVRSPSLSVLRRIAKFAFVPRVSTPGTWGSESAAAAATSADSLLERLRFDGTLEEYRWAVFGEGKYLVGIESALEGWREACGVQVGVGTWECHPNFALIIFISLPDSSAVKQRSLRSNSFHSVSISSSSNVQWCSDSRWTNFSQRFLPESLHE